MSALSNTSAPEVLRGLIATAEPYFREAIWAYYAKRKDDVLFSKWFITIRLRDVRFLIEDIAGPEPSPIEVGI
jgi:hypothetical protein